MATSASDIFAEIKSTGSTFIDTNIVGDVADVIGQNKKDDKATLYIQDQKDKNKFLLNRELLAKYTKNHREMRQMNDIQYLNYATFLMRQQDVHATEEIKDAVETTRNAKDIKTYTEFVKVSKTVAITSLMIAICALGLLVPLYAYVFKKDVVKRSINYQLFPMAFYLIIIFCFYVYLYRIMNSLVKKIMTLL